MCSVGYSRPIRMMSGSGTGSAHCTCSHPPVMWSQLLMRSWRTRFHLSWGKPQMLFKALPRCLSLLSCVTYKLPSLQIPPFTSDVLTYTKPFFGSSPPRCVPISNHQGDVLSTTWADTRPSGGPQGARFVPRALRVSGKKGWSGWMWRFDGKENIIGAEGGLRGRSLARRPDKRNFGYDSHAIPSGIWRAGSATCCGSWKCTCFPQKPPALPVCRAICLAKTLVLSCRCCPFPVPPHPPHRPAETLLLHRTASAWLHTQMSCEVILTRRDGKGNEFFRPARYAITPRHTLVCIASTLGGPKPLHAQAERCLKALPACEWTLQEAFTTDQVWFLLVRFPIQSQTLKDSCKNKIGARFS